MADEEEDEGPLHDPDLKVGQIRFMISDRHKVVTNSVADATLAAFYSQDLKTVQVFIAASSIYTPQTKIALFMELGNACINAAARAAQELAVQHQQQVQPEVNTLAAEVGEEMGNRKLTSFPSRGNSAAN